MKNGVYYSNHWNETFLVNNGILFDEQLFERVIFFPCDNDLEYICEFWNESAELERYKCAIDIAKRNFKQLVLARCSVIEALEFVDKFNEEIDQILNAGVQE